MGLDSILPDRGPGTSITAYVIAGFAVLGALVSELVLLTAYTIERILARKRGSS